jgi:hypothetical protein
VLILDPLQPRSNAMSKPIIPMFSYLVTTRIFTEHLRVTSQWTKALRNSLSHS